MAFTREELAAYEKSTPATTETTPPAASSQETPPAENKPAAADSSPAADPGEPPVTASDDASGANADSPTAAAPDSETTETDAAAPRSAPKAIPYDRFQEVVDEKNSYRELSVSFKTETERLRAELEALKKGSKPAETSPAVPAETTDKQPTLEDHNYDLAAFTKAQNEWLNRQLEKSRQAIRQEAQQDQQKQTAEQIANEYRSREEALRKSDPEFDTLLKTKQLPKLAQGTAKAIVLSKDLGPAVVKHLLKNEAVAAQLAAQDPEQQLITLGEIKARLGAASTTVTPPSPPAKKKQVTQAPPPPTPAPAGTTTAVKNVLDGSMSMEEFVQHERQAKIRQREERQRIRSSLR